MDKKSRFHPPHVDIEMMRLKMDLPPAKRVLSMLNARELMKAMQRSRLKARHPHLSWQEINLKIAMEPDRAREHPKPEFLR